MIDEDMILTSASTGACTGTHVTHACTRACAHTHTYSHTHHSLEPNAELSKKINECVLLHKLIIYVAVKCLGLTLDQQREIKNFGFYKLRLKQ